MFCIKEDLGLIMNKQGTQRHNMAIFVCRCGEESKPLKKTDVFRRKEYKCGSCSQIVHGLSKNKEHRNALAKIWREDNLEKVRYTHRKASRKYKEKNKEKIDNYHYLKNYNMTKKEAIELKKRGCFICGSMNTCVIDHDHKTGKVRGILCDNHNKGLGLLGDTYEDVIKTLEKLKKYFEK